METPIYSFGSVYKYDAHLNGATPEEPLILGTGGDFTQLSDTRWHLVGSEDTNGDSHSDLLWWNATTGEVSRWLLNGTAVTRYGGDTAQVQDTTWQPTAIR